MSHELSKAYDPAEIEQRWADYWVRENLFHAATPADGSNVYSILLPPPNVTGRLHMGHMLNHTEIDILIRWQRMQGRQSMWLPGTDHAGIATQMMVERQLASEGKKRLDLGREKFLERVWQWKEQYGGYILEQMKRLGDSVDWSREFFTMDEHLSRAVREAFVRMWEEGLIYRGTYIVNWCPRCLTALSDLEVVHDETQAKLWEIRYPVAGMPGESIVVATTRPETMLGDTAVAVNPLDERYAHLHGKKVVLPLVGREIPIIFDELAQPEFGTGAVKVTPAHDPNDFEAGKRHGLEELVVMDETAHMNENAGAAYAGLDRYAAREKVIADLEASGALVSAKDYTVPLGKCDRCKTVVEPRISTQWFLAVNKNTKDGRPSLARVARDVVEDGRIKFTPENYKAIYLQWMENIHDWCISRQLWWGHRIPAWHCADCAGITVERTDPTACAHCGSAKIEQDSDVLDTWFSSGLLPMSALGWPEKTPDTNAFYPTSTLVTGFDILFFWVARMIMLGCHMMDEQKPGHEPRAGAPSVGAYPPRQPRDIVPFREVYIHALVRDAERQKMSKTKGNVVDPIGVIEKFGTDAARFTLAAMAAPGTDIAFSESRTESYRAFANKIWNAARFLFMNVDRAAEQGIWSLVEFAEGETTFTAATLEDRWILSRLNRVSAEVTDALKEYRFHEAAHVVYHFFWDEYCAWYVELVKPRLLSENREEARAAFSNTVRVFDAALRLLAPFMPFITEEIWHALYDGKPPLKSIALAAYPQCDPAQLNEDAEREMAIVQDLIVSVRNLRAELKVPPREMLAIELFAAADVAALIQHNAGALEKLANVSTLTFVNESLAKRPDAMATARFELRLVYEQKVDAAAERARFTRELEKLEAEYARNASQLGNAGFLAKAPAKVVDGLRSRRAELEALIEKLKVRLAGLSAAEGEAR